MQLRAAEIKLAARNYSVPYEPNVAKDTSIALVQVGGRIIAEPDNGIEIEET